MAISVNARATLMKKANVQMVYTGRDGRIKVGVDKKVPATQLTLGDLVPEKVEDQPTDVVVVGKIVAREFTGKNRPCPGGFSCGHGDVTAGTLGIWVHKDGKNLILSNNHVLANSNEASPGDWIRQPGRADGGQDSDRIARLTDFVTINTGGDTPGGCTNLPDIPWPWKAKSIEQPYPNLVDCALAEEFGNGYSPDIYQLGRPTKMRPAIMSEGVLKAGRTTEITRGTIEGTDVSVQVSYGPFAALFDDQLLIEPRTTGGPFSAGGDSGSAILSADKSALVGLLFAGGTMDDGTDVTIACKIEHVQQLMGFSL